MFLNHILETVSQSWFWRYFFSHLGWADWTLGAFVLIGLAIGLKNGLSQELPRMIEMLTSLYVTFEFHTYLAGWLVRETPLPETYARVLTFGLIWFFSWLTLRLLFGIAGRAVHLEVAAPIQGMGGMILGGLRYYVFFAMISYLLILFPLDWIHHSYQVESWSGPTLSQVVPKLHDGFKEIWQKKGVS